MKKLVKCPRCKKEAEYSQDNLYRPFCSERCQMIDLGLWAEAKYAVPGDTVNIDSPNMENQDEKSVSDHESDIEEAD
ncbi:MAG: DNA gyrase inhibitor YacG [Bdellovibrionales bacterium]